jgi:putative flippase GtrA
VQVKFARDLFERVRHLIHEMAKFGVIGIIGTVVTVVGFHICHHDFKMGLFTANAIATVVATIVTFVGNKYWTFRHRAGHGTTRETVMFFVLNGVGMMIQYACVWIAADVFGVKNAFLTDLVLLIGIGIATVFRFWSYRKWVWHIAPAEPPPVEASPRGDLVHPR